MVITSGTIIQRKSVPTAGAIRRRGSVRFMAVHPEKVKTDAQAWARSVCRGGVCKAKKRENNGAGR